MKKIKAAIIFISFIIILLLVAIIILKLYEGKKKNIEHVEINKNLVQLNSRSSYFDIKNCVNQYYQSLEQNNIEYMAEEGELNEQYIIQKYKALLDQEYIKEFGITDEYILATYKDANMEFIIDNIYKKDYTENLSLYFVYGRNINYNTNQAEKTGLIIKTDTKNSSFSVYPYEYIAKYNLEEKELHKNIDTIKEPKELKINEYNFLGEANIYDELIIEEYLNKFKLDIQYSPELIYDKLYETYKKENFKSKEEFLEKAEALKGKILESQLKDYTIETNDNETIYKCVDTEGIYYMFKEKALFDYTIFLDFNI